MTITQKVLEMIIEQRYHFQVFALKAFCHLHQIDWNKTLSCNTGKKRTIFKDIVIFFTETLLHSQSAKIQCSGKDGKRKTIITKFIFIC